LLLIKINFSIRVEATGASALPVNLQSAIFDLKSSAAWSQPVLAHTSASVSRSAGDPHYPGRLAHAGRRDLLATESEFMPLVVLELHSASGW